MSSGTMAFRDRRPGRGVTALTVLATVVAAQLLSCHVGGPSVAQLPSANAESVTAPILRSTDQAGTGSHAHPDGCHRPANSVVSVVCSATQRHPSDRVAQLLAGLFGVAALGVASHRCVNVRARWSWRDRGPMPLARPGRQLLLAMSVARL